MASSRTGDFEQLLGAVGRELGRRELPYMIIGGQAVLLHGEPRLTRDIDVTLGIDPGRVGEALEACAALGLTPLPEDVPTFVQRTFVLPALEEETGVRVDLIFSTTPYERQAIARAVSVELAGTPVSFASVEDLILHKLFAGRPRDLEDAKGVALRNSGRVDWDYAEHWAVQFAAVPGKEDLVERIRRLREETSEEA